MDDSTCLATSRSSWARSGAAPLASGQGAGRRGASPPRGGQGGARPLLGPAAPAPRPGGVRPRSRPDERARRGHRRGLPAVAVAPERRPAIVAVDDEPAVLAAVSRDLRRGFGERYRILRAGSGGEALELLGGAARRAGAGGAPARRPADARHVRHRLPRRGQGPGARRQARPAHRLRRHRGGDRGDQRGALDYYLLKPWDPPEEELFPVLEDLLTVWHAGAARRPAGCA